MAETTIKVENVSKQYKLGQVGTGTLAHDLNRWWAGVRGKEDPYATVGTVNDRKAAGTQDYVWALRDISFEVQQGEILGIIGANGAGKSTLLKLLSKVTGPTRGTIRMKGRTGTLLEVGTGMHPEMTGKENIFLNGAILGMTKNEIAQKLDDIVQFAGVAKYIDTPIKRYSSGMKVRLGFAVAAFLEPEILIIDEVLAVGDISFQQKCIDKIDDVGKGGRTILFVSHNMAAVQGLCTRCILLENGSIAYAGDVEETIEKYREQSLYSTPDISLAHRTDRNGAGNFRFQKISINNGKGIEPHQPVKIQLHYQAERLIENLQVTVNFCRNYNDVIMKIDNKNQGELFSVEPGSGELRIDIPSLNLMPNTYSIALWAGVGLDVEDHITDVANVTVLDKDVYGTGISPDPRSHGVVIAPKCEWVANRG